MNRNDTNNSSGAGVVVKPVAAPMTADIMLEWWPLILELEQAEIVTFIQSRNDS